MLFNSQTFLLVFLPIVVASFWLLARYRHSGHPGFRLLLLLASIAVNYMLISILVKSPGPKKHFLIIGIALNLSVLGFFKYFNFFVDNLPASFGFDGDRFNIVLPLAISFFTFQQISALVDATRKKFHNQNFLDYALFVSFFPQLIAGPIVRHDELVPQLQNMPDQREIDTKIARGLLLLTLGLVKKVFIADNLAQIANPLFDASLKAGLHIVDAWIATFAFGFQIYFDFSGYSDMALGLALMFGIVLPVNFKTPYKSQSLTDFWRTWHITLSSFLRDYLYIPLGGSRHGPARRASAVATTMLLGGLWHGAGWNFIIWGGLHGAGIAINQIWRRLGFKLLPLIGWALTFTFVMIAFLIFRAESATSIYNLLMSVIGLAQPETLWKFSLDGLQVTVLAAAFIIALGLPEPYELSQRQFWKTPQLATGAAVLLVVIIIYLGGPFEQEFIYFQF